MGIGSILSISKNSNKHKPQINIWAPDSNPNPNHVLSVSRTPGSSLGRGPAEPSFHSSAAAAAAHRVHQGFQPPQCPSLEQHREMGEQSFLDRMLSHLRSTSKYYTGYPKDLGPSRVVHFTSERQFVQLLHEGRPVVVAFTIKCPYAKHLDEVLEEAAAEFYPHIKFMRVECPKYPGFCITRQKKDYPFIEVFYNPEQAANEGRVVDPNITKYAVKVLPYTYDQSAYGFREFFKRHKMMHAPDSK